MFRLGVATIPLFSANDGFQMEASWVACEVLLSPLFSLARYLAGEGLGDRHYWLWAGVAAGLCQLTKGNGHLLAVAFLLSGLALAGGLTYTVVVTVFPVGEAGPDLRDPYAVGLEANTPRDDASPGVHRVEAGIYNGDAMERLPVVDMDTGLVLDDHLVLPAMVRIGR